MVTYTLHLTGVHCPRYRPGWFNEQNSISKLHRTKENDRLCCYESSELEKVKKWKSGNILVVTHQVTKWHMTGDATTVYKSLEVRKRNLDKLNA